MKDIVYIVGHKNPDTDSICSAIAYAELKRAEGFGAVARRLGNVNRETAFVLDHFGVEKPEFLATVKTQVMDLSMDQAYPVRAGTSVKTTWDMMKSNGVKTVPVVDDDEKLIGILSVSDITDEYMDAHENNTIASTGTRLASIAETLDGIVICGSEKDFSTTGKIVIAATDPNEFGEYIGPGDIVITGSRSDSQARALEAGANCMIITCGASPADRILELAAAKGSVVMLTPFDTFSTARLINMSIPAGAIMKSDKIVKFELHDYVDDIQEKMLKTRYRSYPVVDGQDRVQGFISRYHLISRKKKKLILIDHNELAQAVDGIEQAEIMEIIDHHRLGDIQTMHPIYVQSEPVGSTASIVAGKYLASGHEMPAKTAGLLCAAILSDTIRFKSPTCTGMDVRIANQLARIAGIEDIEAFAGQMFKAGSALIGRSPDDIFHQDFKEYTFDDRRIGMGQIFTVDPEGVEEIAGELVEYMTDLCSQGRYRLLMLFATDVLKESSLVFCAGSDTSLVEKAFGVQVVNNTAYLPGIVSRKKQVIPQIAAAMENS